MGCKDFKNWQSSYNPEISITFKPEKDALVPAVFKDLRSEKLAGMSWHRCIEGGVLEKVHPLKQSNPMKIPLKPDQNAVAVEIRDSEAEARYYHKITIYYKRKVSLISPEAGGLQQKYILTHVVFSTQPDKQPIFKSHEIESAVPLKTKEAEKKTHVTIYY